MKRRLSAGNVLALLFAVSALWLSGAFEAKRNPPDLRATTSVEGVFSSTYVNKGRSTYIRHEVKATNGGAVRVYCFDGQYGNPNGCPNLLRFHGKAVSATLVDSSEQEKNESPRKLLYRLDGPGETMPYLNKQISEWQGGKGRVTSVALLAFMLLLTKLLTHPKVPQREKTDINKWLK